MAKRFCIIPSLLALLIFIAATPVSAEGMRFQEWGLTAFGNLSMDVDRGDLYQGGVLVHLAMPLIDNHSVRLDFRLEGLLGVFCDYDRGMEMAILPGLRLYLGKAAIIPYVEGGVGPSYNNLDIEELGMSFNFLSFSGVGLRFPLQNNLSIEVGYRLRHISNAGLDDRNHGVTSNQCQVGIAWAF